MTSYTLALLPGDGIGRDVMIEAEKVLKIIEEVTPLSFEINKIIACILIVALVFIGLANFSEILYEVEKPEVAHYKIEGVEDSTVLSSETHSEEAVVVEIEESIISLLAGADISKGAKVFKKCSQCHVVEKDGTNKIGPALWGVLGRPSGSVPGYKYSKAMAAHGKNWSFEEMNGFLTKPKDWIKGTKMSFAGLKKAKERAAIILYMNENTNSPLPLQ